MSSRIITPIAHHILKQTFAYSLPALMLFATLLLLHLFGQWNNPLVIMATAILVLTGSIFFHNHAAIYKLENWRPQRRWVLTSLSYFAIILAALALTGYSKLLAIESNIPLNPYHFYKLNPAAIAALGSIAFLLVALYLFSHRLMMNIAMIGLSKHTRLMALAVALIVATPLLIVTKLGFPFFVLLLAIFIYIALFDLFIDNQIPGITWFVIWLVLFALYTATVLYRYTASVSSSLHYLISLFSCAFLMLTLTVLMLFLLSRLFLNASFPIIGKPSLRNRIQVLVILLMLLAFAVVGAITVSFFQDNVPDWERHIYNFIDQLIKIYTFLLLTTGVLAIAVANSITRPIVRVGNELRHLQLGKNEPIAWQSQDEIGELITEYNRMIIKLEDSTEKLKISERESAWREMAKQVAHEIKNPLTPMKLSIQYLQRAAKSNPEEAQTLVLRVSDTLIEQIDGLARIASEFSNFAKMPKPDNQVFTLNEVVQSVFDLFAQNPENGIALSLQLPSDNLCIFADKDHIVRVLNNLIKNAIQAIPEGKQGKIDVSLYANNDRAIVQVQDNGSGIPPEMRERIFQPNFTTKNSGTGLGLAMSKSIVEAAGGSLSFESKEHEGTCFFVALPITQAL